MVSTRRKRVKVNYAEPVDVSDDSDYAAEASEKESSVSMIDQPQQAGQDDSDVDFDPAAPLKTKAKPKKKAAKGKSKKKEPKIDPSLERFSHLPVELMAECFKHLNFKDIWHLTLCCKMFRNLLAVKSSKPIWKEVMQNNKFPKLAEKMSPLHTASLLWGDTCNECGEKSVNKGHFLLRKNLCQKCLDELTIAPKDIESCVGMWVKLHSAVLPIFEKLYCSRNTRYYKSEVKKIDKYLKKHFPIPEGSIGTWDPWRLDWAYEKITGRRRRWNAVPLPPAARPLSRFSAYVVDHQKKNERITKDAETLANWNEGRNLQINSRYEEIVVPRIAKIKKRLLNEEGWTEADFDADDNWRRYSFPSGVERYHPLTEEEFIGLLPSLEQWIAPIRVRRAEEERRNQQRQRQIAIRQGLYADYTERNTESILLLPLNSFLLIDGVKNFWAEEGYMDDIGRDSLQLLRASDEVTREAKVAFAQSIIEARNRAGRLMPSLELPDLPEHSEELTEDEAEAILSTEVPASYVGPRSCTTYAFAEWRDAHLSNVLACLTISSIFSNASTSHTVFETFEHDSPIHCFQSEQPGIIVHEGHFIALSMMRRALEEADLDPDTWTTRKIEAQWHCTKCGSIADPLSHVLTRHIQATNNGGRGRTVSASGPKALITDELPRLRFVPRIAVRPAYFNNW